MNELERTIMTMSCRDTDRLPKVPDAGSIVDRDGQSVQVMHNGLQVVAGGYFGDWMAQIIRGLRGHHEPQEEVLFDEVVRLARHNTTFVELGCFWSYYSCWYLTQVPGSRAVCIEPDATNIDVGMRNAALNGVADRASFHRAWVAGTAEEAVTHVGESTLEPTTLPAVDMGAVLALCDGQPIEVLHMDVQGAEHPFLGSMADAVGQGLVRFLVVSTHHSSISGSRTTHFDCLDAIRTLGGHILAEHSVQESFSGDGLIVASFYDEDRRVVLPEISRNAADASMFPSL